MSTATTRMSETDFVRSYMEVYRTGGTVADLTEKVRMNKNTVMARITSYKKKGAKLPKLERASRVQKMDIDALNALIESMLAGETTPTEQQEEATVEQQDTASV